MNTKDLPTDVIITGEWQSKIVVLAGKQLSPVPSQQIRNHSPDGFNWSYGGSGPAQLALAILLKFMHKDDAQRYYQSFKFQFIGKLPAGNFSVHLNLKDEIEKIINKKERLL